MIIFAIETGDRKLSNLHTAGYVFVNRNYNLSRLSGNFPAKFALEMKL